MAGRFEGPVGRREPHPDEEIVVYHNTSPEHAAILKQYGTTRPKPTKAPTIITNEFVARALGKNVGESTDFEPGRGLGSGLYVSRHPGHGIQYGTHALPVRIKARDLAVPPERAHRESAGMTPWRSLNVGDGYVPHHISADQFGDVYTNADWREWDNEHG